MRQCVMECFTFLRMGGALERIEVSMIAHPDENPAEARQELKAQFASFDAAKAECFLPKDRHRLLAIVEAGFGDFEEFNKLMRGVFETRLKSSGTQRWLQLRAAAKLGEKGASSAEAPAAAVLPQAVEVEIVG